MHPQTNKLSQKRATESGSDQLTIGAAQGALKQTLSHHLAGEFEVLQLQMGWTGGIRMDQRLVLVMEGAEETSAGVEECTADQLKPLPPQTSPVDALFTLEGDLEVATPVGHREALDGLHAALQDLLALHFQGHLLVIVAGMEFANLVVKEVLLVLEGLRSTNVLQQKMGEGGSYDIPILGGQLNLGLGSVVYDENRAVQLGHQLRQEMELGRGTQPECGNPLGDELEDHLLDGHLEDQRVLSPHISPDVNVLPR